MFQAPRALLDGDPGMPDAAMDLGPPEIHGAQSLLMLQGYVQPSGRMSCGWPGAGIVTR